MTPHEEAAKEILSLVVQRYPFMSDFEKGTHAKICIGEIVKKLASAEKKGREEGYIIGSKDTIQLHNTVWNQAIEESVKVAEEMGEQEGIRTACGLKIADKIKALKK